MKDNYNSRARKRLFRVVIWALCLIPAIILVVEQNWKVVIPFMIFVFLVFVLAESYLKGK